MKEEKSPSPFVIIDPLAADVLINPKTLRQLEPFLGRACTVSQAAQETRTKANTMLSQVRRFVRLGLIRIVKEEKRGGRAIKHYQSTAEGFFVPYEATTAETLEAMMAERDTYWESLLRQGVVKARIEDIGTWGTRIYKDERGRLQIQTAVTPERDHTMLDADRPAALSAWRDSVYLDFADAKTLQQEMFSLLLRYQQKQGAQRYIIRLGMAPVDS
jgi:hypothetical protein